MIIRRYHPDDTEGCFAVYLSAIRDGAHHHYSAAQRHAWAPHDMTSDWMPDRLEDGDTWVAEASGEIRGFLTLRADGHLDLFFVHVEVMGTGAAAHLYDTMLAAASAAGLTRLTTDASHYARRFLERRGWRLIAEESVLRNGAVLTRFKMDLALDAPPT